jgi:hypothetical protein
MRGSAERGTKAEEFGRSAVVSLREKTREAGESSKAGHPNSRKMG